MKTSYIHTHYCIHSETKMKVEKVTVKLFLCMPQKEYMISGSTPPLTLNLGIMR